MRNGFTLIELLSVIVILAIISLIATPIVLGIIDDAKESAQIRSAEMYLSGVENSIAKENIEQEGNFKTTECTIIDKGNLNCDDREEIIEIEVEVDGEKPKNGTITFEAGKIRKVRLEYENAIIVKNEEGNLVFEEELDVEEEPEKEEEKPEEKPKEDIEVVKTLDTICTYLNNGVAEKTAGAKYSCEVKEGTSYNFFVLTTPQEGSETINLIMERNICEDGTLATEENRCTVAWQVSGANADGPVTVMDYLYNGTKDWTNIPNIEMNYTDEGNAKDYGYGTIVTIDGITKITKKDGTAVTVLTGKEGYSNLKARLPYNSEVSDYDSTNKKNAYLYDYFSSYNNIQTNAISGINGYWTLSSNNTHSNLSRDVGYTGRVGNDSVDSYKYVGVRPVITLKL